MKKSVSLSRSVTRNAKPIWKARHRCGLDPRFARKENIVVLPAQSANLHLLKRTHKGPLRDTLARNMRRLRAARGLSQEALAHECGINRTYLSGVERSERNVSIDNIARIARGLKVKPYALLDDSAKL